MVDVTLLEVNLQDAELTANAPFSGEDGPSNVGKPVSKLFGRSSSKSTESSTDDADGEAGDEADVAVQNDGEEAGGPSPFAPLLALLALFVVLLVVRKLRGGDETENDGEPAE